MGGIARALAPLDPLAVAGAAAGRLATFLRGLEAWQRHPYRRACREPPVVWSDGAARLLDYGGSGPAAVVVPSLINRAYVLDLLPDRSLMRHLAGSGARALLLDWGRPGPAEAGFALADYIDRRLLPALGAVGRPALVGYCMGGALAVGALVRAPDAARALALIGTPWDFTAGAGIAVAVRRAARHYGPEKLRVALRDLDRGFGAVPAELLQALFALLDPGLALAKFRRFARMDPASAAARQFVALEDWLNDPVPLPGPAAVEVLVDWQVENATARRLWRPGGVTADPGRLALPTLAFCSISDRIAPPSATEPLARAIPGARILRPRGGHVGMIVGRAATAEVLDPLARFLADAGPTLRN